MKIRRRALSTGHPLVMKTTRAHLCHYGIPKREDQQLFVCENPRSFSKTSVPSNSDLYSVSSEILPLLPYSYASQLVARAEQEFGDCHTFLRKSFLRRFHATYSGHQSETHDRKWLCRLFFVLALAECTTTTKRPIQLTPNGAVATASPTEDSSQSKDMLSAGVELFEHGLALLNISYEEPTVDDVEALNLAVSGTLPGLLMAELIKESRSVVPLLLHPEPSHVSLCVCWAERKTGPLLRSGPSSSGVLA